VKRVTALFGKRGASSIEYTIIAAVISMAILVGATGIGQKVGRFTIVWATVFRNKKIGGVGGMGKHRALMILGIAIAIALISSLLAYSWLKTKSNEKKGCPRDAAASRGGCSLNMGNRPYKGNG